MAEPVKLLQFAPALGLANASPFCLKLETWLRIAGLKYEPVNADPRKTPHGKLPMIEHEGKRIADSSCAIAYLEQSFGIKLNASLNPSERASAHALQRMLEEHSYWAILHFRWLNEDNWPATREAFFGNFNALLKSLAPGIVRKQIRRDAHGQGLHRHDEEEIQRRFGEDMRALAGNLGEKPYFGGYQPANIDATAYAFLAQVVIAQPRTVLSEIVAGFPDLVTYTQRMHQRYFPEYA